MSMHDPSAAATPTAAERQLAHRIWNDALCNSEVPGWHRDDLLAQALADQRAKYEAVADELDRWGDNAVRYAAHSKEDSITAAMARARAMAYARAVERLRAVA